MVQNFSVGLCFFFVATYGNEAISMRAKNPEMIQIFFVGLCFFVATYGNEDISMGAKPRKWS